MTDQTRAQGVIPHLVVRDAAAALEFYKNAMGATETMRLPAEDGKRLMHSEIQINGARVFVRDHFPEYRSMSPDPYPHFTWRVESHRVELVRQVLESASPK